MVGVLTCARDGCDKTFEPSGRKLYCGQRCRELNHAQMRLQRRRELIAELDRASERLTWLKVDIAKARRRSLGVPQAGSWVHRLEDWHREVGELGQRIDGLLEEQRAFEERSRHTRGMPR